jgi:hypothetical protein
VAERYENHDTKEPLIGGSTAPWQEPFTGGKAWVYKDITLIDFAECWLDEFEPFDFNTDGIVDLSDYAVFVNNVLGG